MTPADVSQRVARITATRADVTADRSVLQLALVDAEKIRAWADAQTAALVRQLAAVDPVPEETISSTSRCGLGAATKTRERSDTLADTPTLADALEDGDVTAGHVDAVTRGKKKLDTPEEQAEFLERVEELVDQASFDTVRQFSTRLDREIKLIRRGNGDDRLTRQKKMTRARSWTDDDGMWNLHGRFDPTLALGVSSRLDAATNQLFAEHTPEHCPTDPTEKQQFLAAHALAAMLGVTTAGADEADTPSDTPTDDSNSTNTAPDSPTAGVRPSGQLELVPTGDDDPAATDATTLDSSGPHHDDPSADPNDRGTGTGPLTGRDRRCTCGGTNTAPTTGRPEFVAVIDIDADPGHGPRIDYPIPIEVPPHVMADLYPDADVHTIVVRNGAILHAPGRLNLGRTTRLANKSQRRALRALYSCCAVPGCTVGFDRCKIHHIIWWRHGGRTDLENLLPVCTRHHTKIHHDGWTIALGPNRQLTITLPDGRTMTTGPPRRSAA